MNEQQRELLIQMLYELEELRMALPLDQLETSYQIRNFIIKTINELYTK